MTNNYDLVKEKLTKLVTSQIKELNNVCSLLCQCISFVTCMVKENTMGRSEKQNSLGLSTSWIIVIPVTLFWSCEHQKYLKYWGGKGTSKS